MLNIIREGINIFSRNLKVKIQDIKRYEGDDIEICQQIIKSCYDKEKKYFRTSTGNYKVFYSRDFGWCVQALLNLGYKKEIENTLEYAMSRYSKHNEITVAINNKGMPFNFPNTYSPDSVAYLYRSLRIAKAKKSILKYKEFLNQQVKFFESNVIDTNGLLQKKQFSGMRDHIKAQSLCYEMIMACMLCDEIDKINKLMGREIIENPLKKYNLKKKLIKNYWNTKEEYFYDELQTKYCSGHSNTYPYFLDVIIDKRMIKSSIKNIQKNLLDKPFPLKYGHSKYTKFIWIDIFAHDWEKHTQWAMLGMAYIDVVSRIDKKLAKEYLEQYHRLILKHQCFIEVYSEYEPYKSAFFTADDSMLWASMYLDLKNRLRI
jgi:hypothetical protein